MKYNNMELHLKRYEYPEMIKKGLIFPVSYSEIKTLPCSRKYSFKYIEGFSSNSYSRPLTFGISWHYVCEQILIKTIKTDQIMDNKEINDVCDKYLVHFLEGELKNKYFYEGVTIKGEIESIVTQIKLGIIGWAKNWSENIHPRYKVIAVELALGMPISCDGKVLRKKMTFVKHEFKDCEILRLPVSGELDKNGKSFSKDNYVPEIQMGDKISTESLKNTCISKQIKFFKVGKLDCLLQSRETGGLWILDHKTSGSPKGYKTKMQFNLQLHNYCSLVRYAIKEGRFSDLNSDNLIVEGVMWDIASSKYNPMQFDSDGKLKKLKRPIPPYHIVKEYVEKNKLEDSYSDYLDLLEEKNLDKYFLVEEMISEEDMDRCELEDYCYVQEMIIKRKKAEIVNLRSPSDLSVKIPRFTICETYNFCQFYINCFANTAMHKIQYKREANMFWRSIL